jgi:hypothetical protein
MAPPIRARDLQVNIREHGFERGVVVTLNALLDEFAEHRQHMRELTELLVTCVDQVGSMIQAGTLMRDALEQIKRDRTTGESLNEDGQP